jgi:DNA polymerase
MHRATATDFASWRKAARGLLGAGVPPEQVGWEGGRQPDLLAGAGELHRAGAGELHRAGAGDSYRAGAGDSYRAGAGDVHHAGARSDRGSAPAIPRTLLDALEACACHRDRPWPLMYRLLWRATHGEREVLDLAADDDVRALALSVKAVNRDCHKMKAFVRFREAPDGADGVRYVAWFEPEHHILARVAPFFVTRFAGMRWTIATPDGVATWDGERLALLAPEAAGALPAADAAEPLWRTYYERIFNPARLNVSMMRKEMPVRYWKHLPEAAAIPALVAAAGTRTRRMIEAPPTAPRAAGRGSATPPAPPADESLDTCRRCDLWRNATQAVPGRGPGRAPVMLVGEQPGDEEDLKGEPFVGPAGRLLDRLLAEADLARDAVHLTNAVKHFKWEPRGKRRLHKTPAQQEIDACHVWLEREIGTVAPRVIVALGGTALKSLGVKTGVGAAREASLRLPSGPRIVATWHPSAILRAEGERAAAMHAQLVDDLRKAARLAARA